MIFTKVQDDWVSFFTKISPQFLRTLFDHERCKIEMFLQDIRSTIRASASRRQLKVEEIPPEILRLNKDTLVIKLRLTFRSFSEHVRRYTLSGRL